MTERPFLGEDNGDKKEDASLLKRLLKARAILVSEVISDTLARKVTSELLLMQEDDAKKPITVYINSPGGSADSGFGIYDVLRFVRPPIRTIVTGLCASAAVTIYLAAKKKLRYALPNSRFLLHQPSTTAMGSASDMQITAEEIMKLKKQYNTIVSDETGKPEKEIAKDADRDFWLSSAEAKEYGLVGSVIQSYDELK